MQQEAKYIADELEILGLQILCHCDQLPEFIIHWPLFPGEQSLFILALETITLIEEGILIPIGGTSFSSLPCSKKSSIETLAHLRTSYVQWIQEARKLLDVLPNSLLDCYIDRNILPPTMRKISSKHGRQIRSCLLHTLIQISIISGKMQAARQLFIDGERTLEEMTKTFYLDDPMQNGQMSEKIFSHLCIGA